MAYLSTDCIGSDARFSSYWHQRVTVVAYLFGTKRKFVMTVTMNAGLCVCYSKVNYSAKSLAMLGGLKMIWCSGLKSVGKADYYHAPINADYSACHAVRHASPATPEQVARLAGFAGDVGK